MANLSDLTSWAVPRLSNLLPLPEDELRQVVSYAATSPDLSNPSAIATHFTDLLGSSPGCLSFIEEFNRRRFPAAPSASKPRQSSTRNDSDAPPRSNRKGTKKKEPLSKLPPVRKIENNFSGSSENLAGKVYKKEDLDDYMSTSRKKMASNSNPTSKPTSQTPSRSTTPNPPMGTSTTSTSTSTAPVTHQSQKQPAQQGMLTSDLLNKKKASKPKPTTVSVPANTTMRAPSSTLSDVSSALRSLELQTNPTLTNTHTLPVEKRRCNCSGRKHELLLAAPNCLHCGKIICIKEGLALCTFCGHDLISSEDMEAMRRILRDEQSKEKMNAHNAGHRKAETTKTTAVYASKVNPSAGGVNHLSGPTPALSASGSSAALASAMEQRDKLLGFQSSSAKRTRIIDQAADWETPDSGVNMWATPQERALQLREQQRKMRELEWENRDEWEKRSVVVSIDLKGKRVERRMGAIEKPKFEVEAEKEEDEEVIPFIAATGGGTFSKNPLLVKGLIKPVWKPHNNTKNAEDDNIESSDDLGQWGKKIRSGWRVVQDDMNDNEALILDGGRLGGETTNEERGTETSCG
ncbi:hypothetical protein AOL_s00188g308 [Orbilia oligospora ATCC 24927]|uniref:TRIP4/RQT4 C2HC5-type zinc finger domain-containing protein n=2 Tax=Orbilia oligospora TaxID=2813651 RepID=G1XQU6_ARTOA|nr:hypothetical protein AOL_s00188g308 [Orbilia oligospora ATCC 24927]EGX44640.1 hypothetical protein AOL_s00188g308 [Orbilia oligospora ATCC 24927]KAF3280443.1 hypothetical protein TWF970_002663 [Orbilia oligospora]